MRKSTQKKITQERLRRALQTMTDVIDHHGEKYWPIFDVLKILLEAESSKEAQLSKYRRQPAMDRSDRSTLQTISKTKLGENAIANFQEDDGI